MMYHSLSLCVMEEGSWPLLFSILSGNLSSEDAIALLGICS
ncbi:MAG: hypothetical protein ACKO2V_07765 [Snowella sp.]